MALRMLKKIKFEYSSFVGREPMLAPLYWPNIWWQQYKIWRPHSEEGGSPWECFVSDSTEFVLDGFQGSANSFATQAFRASQDRPVEMARSMHAPAQIIKAVRKSIPTLVTLRNPRGAVLSLTSRWPYVSPHQALRSYIGFYNKIEPYRDGYVLSPFEHTTQHFDLVIQRVNKRFGTHFDIYDEAVVKMESRHGPEDDKPVDEKRREARKEEKAEQLHAPQCSSLLQTAQELHQRMKDTVPSPESSLE